MLLLLIKRYMGLLAYERKNTLKKVQSIGTMNIMSSPMHVESEKVN